MTGKKYAFLSHLQASQTQLVGHGGEWDAGLNGSELVRLFLLTSIATIESSCSETGYLGLQNKQLRWALHACLWVSTGIWWATVGNKMLDWMHLGLGPESHVCLPLQKGPLQP